MTIGEVIAALGLLVTVATFAFKLWWESRRAHKESSPPPPPPPLPSSTPPPPPPTLQRPMSPLPAPPVLLNDPSVDEAKDYPAFLGVSKLPSGRPIFLQQHSTPGHVTSEIRRIPAPLSREQYARDNFVGRWARWTGIVSDVNKGDTCYTVHVNSAGRIEGLNSLVTLIFPLRRLFEVQVLRPGQEITYQGQILAATEAMEELVHVEILPTV